MIDIVPNWHPVWVHFAIGLPIIGTLFYAIAWIGGERPCAGGLLAAARWNLTAGIAFALAALLTGFLAAGSVPHDDAAHANMLVHRNWALAAAFLFGSAAVLIWIEWRKAAQRARIPVLLILLAGSGALAVTGFEGGQNVFEHGLGVRRLPDTGHHDHANGGHRRGGADQTAPVDGHGAHQHEVPSQTPDAEAEAHDHDHSSTDTHNH